MYILRQICLASKPLFLPLQNGNEQYSLFTVVWLFSETKYVKAFSSLLQMLILSLTFPLLFFGELCLYFILVHSAPSSHPHSILGFSHCFYSNFFCLILSLWFSPLSPLWMFFLSVFFSFVAAWGDENSTAACRKKGAGGTLFSARVESPKAHQKE